MYILPACMHMCTLRVSGAHESRSGTGAHGTGVTCSCKATMWVNWNGSSKSQFPTAEMCTLDQDFIYQ